MVTVAINNDALNISFLGGSFHSQYFLRTQKLTTDTVQQYSVLGLMTEWVVVSVLFSLSYLIHDSSNLPIYEIIILIPLELPYSSP